MRSYREKGSFFLLIGIETVWEVAWFKGGLVSTRLKAGLDGLKGLFQPEQFYD